MLAGPQPLSHVGVPAAQGEVSFRVVAHIGFAPPSPAAPPEEAAPELLAPDEPAPELLAPDEPAPELLAPDEPAPELLAPDEPAPELLLPDDVPAPLLALPELALPLVALPELALPELATEPSSEPPEPPPSPAVGVLGHVVVLDEQPRGTTTDAMPIAAASLRAIFIMFVNAIARASRPDRHATRRTGDR